MTFRLSTGDAVDSTVLSRNSVPLVTVELHRSRQGSGTTVFDYGSPFTGIKHAEVSTSDGNSFVTLIDGKSTATFVRGSDLSSVRFQDGTAIPVVGSTEPALIDQMTTLFNQMVSSGATGCATPCKAMLPSVAVWHAEYAEIVKIAIVSRGGAKKNLEKVGSQELPSVLLQQDREVADAFQC